MYVCLKFLTIVFEFFVIRLSIKPLRYMTDTIKITMKKWANPAKSFQQLIFVWYNEQYISIQQSAHERETGISVQKFFGEHREAFVVKRDYSPCMVHQATVHLFFMVLEHCSDIWSCYYWMASTSRLESRLMDLGWLTVPFATNTCIPTAKFIACPFVF